MCWEESSDTGCFGWCIIRYREYEDQGLCGKIASHSFQCIFFKTGDLGLGDADHVGDLGLGLSFEKAQRDDMTLSVVQTFNGFTEGELFLINISESTRPLSNSYADFCSIIKVK